MVSFLVKQWKIALPFLLGLVLFFLIKFRKKEDKKVRDLTKESKEVRRAVLSANQIKASLSVYGGIWDWTDDEEAIIKVLNENRDIFYLIQKEYLKATKNHLIADLSKYLKPQELQRINIEAIK